jgi:energy-coupling factor transporter ATP-binding protein EcfA2
MPAVSLQTRDLTFSYLPGSPVLRGINLEIEAGTFTAVIGQNGSGKTTLMKHCNGLLRPDAGQVLVNGEDISRQPVSALARRVGYVFQNPDHQFVADTVFDEVAYSLRVRGVAETEVREKVNEVLDLFNLNEYVDLSPFALSMGQRRLLSVATMLVVDQDAIILDEPTIGQDQASSNLLMGYLDRLNRQGKSIIIITHDMRLMSQWVERVVVMSDSHLLFDGHIKDVFIDPDLLEKASLLPPPLVVLMQRLRETNPQLPAMVLTMAEFESLLLPKSC